MVLLVQPVLHLLGPFPPPGVPAGLPLGHNVLRHPWWRAAAVRAGQQAGHAAGLERLDPVEELAAADTVLGGNLGGRELAAGGPAQGEQALVGAHVGAGGERGGHRARQRRPLEPKSLGHARSLSGSQNSAITNRKWYKP